MSALQDRVAMITGAGRGIGRAMALAYAGEGARVALVARSTGQLEDVVREIEEVGGRALAVPTDITDRTAVEESVARIEATLGPIDVLVNNAGSFYAIGPVWDVDAERWWTDVTINLQGTFLCCQSVVKGMVERRRGRVINVIGGGTGVPFAYGSGYASSKAAVMRLTECLAQELAEGGHPVAVFAMGPGLVRTSLTEYQLRSPEGRKWMPRIERMFAEGVNVPPTQAAELAVALASGRFDRLAGRCFSINDPLDALLERQDEIIRKDLKTLRFRA